MLIDDGLVELTVLSVTDTDIVCRVLNEGTVSDHKGVNVPGTELSMPFISEQDYSDICFGIEQGFDFIAASFVRNAEDVLEIRRIFQEKGCNSINIISKIENMQGVKNIDEIIRVSDGIMVARGDMCVEVPLEDVPIIQKMIIHKVYNAGKQVITATPVSYTHLPGGSGTADGSPDGRGPSAEGGAPRRRHRAHGGDNDLHDPAVHRHRSAHRHSGSSVSDRICQTGQAADDDPFCH